MKALPLLILALVATAGISRAGVTNRYDRTFEKADLDRSGFLDSLEWLRTQSRRSSAADAQWRFNWADADNDDRVSLLEFRASRGGKDGGKPNKSQTFDLADADNDGFLTPAEFADTEASGKPWRKILKIFSRKDRDEDSVIDPVEFGIYFTPIRRSTLAP